MLHIQPRGRAMTKGWEFYWQGQRYYVGASDAPSARRYLSIEHLHVAERARSPRELANVTTFGLQLEDGIIRAFPGTCPTE
jgi:hypothetical protein